MRGSCPADPVSNPHAIRREGGHSQSFGKSVLSPELFRGATLGFGESSGVVVGAGEALQVLFGGGVGIVERPVLGPGKNLGIAGALHDTVIDLRVEALVAAEIGEEISASQPFVADHGVGAIRA